MFATACQRPAKGRELEQWRQSSLQPSVKRESVVELPGAGCLKAVTASLWSRRNAWKDVRLLSEFISAIMYV